MADLKITRATTSNMTDNVSDVSIDVLDLDSPGDQKETEWINSDFGKWLGIYKTIPEVKIAIDMRAVWTVGKGYEADEGTKVILERINGRGNQTFNEIIKSLIVLKRMNGDSYAEIIRNKNGSLINLKVLNPNSIKTIFNKKGIILRYEQIDKSGPNGMGKIFRTQDIFHLSNKVIGDEIHGISDIEAIEDIINANKESFDDMRKLQHRFVKPMMKFILDTDKESTINDLVVKFDAAVNKGENLYIPKGTVEQELISVPSNSTLNPLPWREHLRDYFFQVVGIPQIILGSSGEFTESTAKIAYLAFEQSVDDEQNDFEAQFFNQVGLKITLTFPVSLKNELLSDEAKDGSQSGTGFKPSDTTAGEGA